MRRISYTPFVILIISVFFLTSLPSSVTLSLRSFAIRIISPTWRGVNFVKMSTISFLSAPIGIDAPSSQALDRIKELQMENQQLSSQLENLRQWLLSEDRMDEQMQRLKQIRSTNCEDVGERAFLERRAKEIAKILDLQAHSLPAKVIYREPSSWSSFVWVNIGERNNKALGQKIVAKNSPVIANGCLIGVVEDVRNSQSRVRLITDARLFPSVRSCRGKKQDEQLWQQLESLSHLLETREDLFPHPEEKKAFNAFFQRIKKRVLSSSEERYLAKGELHGASAPLWRSRSALLHGVGFNLEREDVEGPSRDLRLGRPTGSLTSLESLAILKEGDLLITSGLDGIFPSGLPVAVIKKIENLKEGASSYQIEAEAVIGSMNELNTLYILPPLNFE